INFLDTANVYSDGHSEEIVGRALKDMVKRDDVVLATKVFSRMRPGPNGAGLSRKAILSEIDHSLRRLGTDHVDLYQIHRWDSAIGDAVGAIAKERGVPRAQVAMAWLLQKPGVTSPIVGAVKPHHLTDAAAAVALKLTADEIRRLEAPYRPHAVAGIGVR